MSFRFNSPYRFAKFDIDKNNVYHVQSDESSNYSNSLACSSKYLAYASASKGNIDILPLDYNQYTKGQDIKYTKLMVIVLQIGNFHYIIMNHY